MFLLRGGRRQEKQLYGIRATPPSFEGVSLLSLLYHFIASIVVSCHLMRINQWLSIRNGWAGILFNVIHRTHVIYVPDAILSYLDWSSYLSGSHYRSTLIRLWFYSLRHRTPGVNGKTPRNQGKECIRTSLSRLSYGNKNYKSVMSFFRVVPCACLKLEEMLVLW